jgi:hypothetical protein
MSEGDRKVGPAGLALVQVLLPDLTIDPVTALVEPVKALTESHNVFTRIKPEGETGRPDSFTVS